jgi:hypothetical protein
MHPQQPRPSGGSPHWASPTAWLTPLRGSTGADPVTYPRFHEASEVRDGTRPAVDTGGRLRFHPGGRVANARYHDCASAHDHDWASNDVATRDHRCARHHRSSHH